MATTVVGAPTETRIDYAELLSGRRKAFILIGVLLGLFLAALDQTIVATALPRIVADLQGLEFYAWTSTSYLLASTTMIPIYGKLSDIYGRKPVVLTGIIVFLLGSVLCGLSQSMLQLVIFRGVQGLGAAALTSTAFAIPADLFAPAERARYQGIFGAVFGLASVIGPFLGGVLTDQYSWHWVFFVNVPVGIVAFTFILTQMPVMHSGVKSRVDWVGAFLLVLGVVPLLLGLTLDKTTNGWGSPLILGLFAVAAVGTIAFLLHQRRSDSPIIPLQLFRIRTYALIIPISMLVGASLFAAILFLSIYLVNVLGVSSTDAGTALIPLMGGLVVGSIVSSAIVQRIGRYKLLILGGLATLAIGFWWLTTIGLQTTLNEVRLRMVVLGLGLGPALPILNLVLQNAVPFQVVGAATASRQFFQQLGQTIGSAIFGVILTTTLTSAMTANLAPIIAQLPPEFATQLDASQLKNGTGGENAAGGAIDVAPRIDASIREQFATQRATITTALVDNDAAAIKTLLASEQTPAELKGVLEAGVTGQNNDAALASINKALDSAEQEALAKGQQVGGEINLAIKQAFVTSVTTIYRYTIPMVLVAFVLALFVPELPLRKTNSDAVVAFE